MSLIEKLDGVLAAVSPLSSKSTPTDVMRASAKALDLLRNHGPAIRQAMIDAERYRWLRDQTLYDGATGEGDQMVWVVTGTHRSDCRPEWGDELDRLVDAGLALNASNEVE